MMKVNKIYNLQLDQETNYNKGLGLVLRSIKPYTWRFILISILVLFTAIIGNSVIPLLTKRAIDQNIAKGDLNGLLETTIIFIVLGIFYLIFSYLRILLTGRLSQKILFNLRRDLFLKIQSLPSQFFSANQSGDIIQRLTGNVDGINNFFSEGLIRVLNTVFLLLAILVSMYIQNWILATVALLGGILMIVFIVIQGRIIEKPITESLKKEGNISGYVQESLDGFVAIQSTNQQKNWTNLFKEKTIDYYRTIKKVTVISGISNAILTTLALLTISIVLFLSLEYYKEGIITLGTVILFLTYSQDFFPNITSVSDLWKNMKTGIASAERISDILELESDISPKENPYSPENTKGDIEFVDVDFAYEKGQKVLSDINFKAEAGRTIAIVGPTGAGKTTFVNLIARLYDVDGGKILVDGVDIKDWDLNILRKNIGYLIQDTFLFEDTILNNLRYNNPGVTEEKALDMFKFLGVPTLVSSLPKKLETKVSSQGNGLSAGQKQIIALARILLREPKILILDEATARIDTKSEKMLQVAIQKACEGKTTFVIAHRLSTIFNSDQIVLIKENTIIEKGTHKELLAKKGFYWEMYSRFIGK